MALVLKIFIKNVSHFRINYYPIKSIYNNILYVNFRYKLDIYDKIYGGENLPTISF